MSDDDIRALVERLEGKVRVPITDGLGPAGGEEPDNADFFVRSFPSTPLAREAAAALTALMAERDEARALESDAREHISTGTQTISQLLRYYAATVHFSRTVRNLFARGAAEIDRLEAMQTPVRCFTCEQTIERADEWFRCFDCGAHLCRLCTAPHFGDAYSRHHAQMERTEYALRGARRAAFARAKEIAEGWETEAAGTEYKTCGNGIFWDPGTNYDQGRIDAAAAIEAEMQGRGDDA